MQALVTIATQQPSCLPAWFRINKSRIKWENFFRLLSPSLSEWPPPPLLARSLLSIRAREAKELDCETWLRISLPRPPPLLSRSPSPCVGTSLPRLPSSSNHLDLAQCPSECCYNALPDCHPSQPCHRWTREERGSGFHSS